MFLVFIVRLGFFLLLFVLPPPPQGSRAGGCGQRPETRRSVFGEPQNRWTHPDGVPKHRSQQAVIAGQPPPKSPAYLHYCYFVTPLMLVVGGGVTQSRPQGHKTFRSQRQKKLNICSGSFPPLFLQKWELVEPLIRQQDLCLAISTFSAGSKVKMELCNAKEPRQVRAVKPPDLRLPLEGHSTSNPQQTNRSRCFFCKLEVSLLFLLHLQLRRCRCCPPFFPPEFPESVWMFLLDPERLERRLHAVSVVLHVSVTASWTLFNLSHANRQLPALVLFCRTRTRLTQNRILPSKCFFSGGRKTKRGSFLYTLEKGFKEQTLLYLTSSDQ